MSSAKLWPILDQFVNFNSAFVCCARFMTNKPMRRGQQTPVAFQEPAICMLTRSSRMPPAPDS